MYLNETYFALMGAIGVITLSLFTTQVAKYFVGVGTFCAFFLLLYAVTNNVNFSMFLAVGLGAFFYNSFDWICQNDMCSAMLLIVVSIIGILMATLFLSDLWYCYMPHSFFEEVRKVLFYNSVTNSYKELLRVLQQI